MAATGTAVHKASLLAAVSLLCHSTSAAVAAVVGRGQRRTVAAVVAAVSTFAHVVVLADLLEHN